MAKIFPIVKKVIISGINAVVNWAIGDQNNLPRITAAPSIDTFQINATESINISTLDAVLSYLFDVVSISASQAVDFVFNFSALGVAIAATVDRFDTSQTVDVNVAIAPEVFLIIEDAVSVLLSQIVDIAVNLDAVAIAVAATIGSFGIQPTGNVAIAISNSFTYSFVTGGFTVDFTMPTGVTLLNTIKCWSPGSGGGAANISGGGGGAGGSFAQKNNLTVTPGTNYKIKTGGVIGFNGGGDVSNFKLGVSPNTIYVQTAAADLPGGTGSATAQGAGATVNTGFEIGDTFFRGGAGGGGGGLGTINGGGGGGSAGSTGNGGAGNSNGTAGTAGTGIGGIVGGTGASGITAGTSGGGGGGASTLATGGGSQDGLVQITFTI